MKETKNVPQLRFSGFDDEWEEKKLNEYLEPSKQKNLDNKYSKNDVLSVSGEFGIVNQIEFQGRSFAGEYVNNYGVVETNDIVYTKSPLNANPYGIIKSNFGKTGIVSTLYAVYKSKNNVDPCFIQTYFDLNKRLNDYLRPLVRKGAKNDMKVSSEDALLGNVVFPSKLEQQKIGAFLSHVDFLIQAKIKKLESLKAVKKSLLQKCFPKADEKVPEMRFAGFNGYWEEKKLGDMGTTFTGLSGKSKEDFGYGNARYLTYISVYKNEISSIEGTDKINIDNSQNTLKYGDILFTTSSEIPEEVGLSSVWLGNEDNIYLNSFCFGYRLRDNVDLLYMAYLLRSFYVRPQIILLAQGISRYNISKYKVMDVKVLLPSLTEQQKIGQFFAKYDSLISLQKKEIENLKTIKKSLLQKMFV